MLGVATLIIVMAVMNGFRAELLTRSSASTAISIVPADRQARSTDYDAVGQAHHGVPGVESAPSR